MFTGNDSFMALVLMIQNSLQGSKFSFVRGSRNNRFVLWCSHVRLQEKTQKDTHVFDKDNFTQDGVKPENLKRKSSRLESSLDAMAGKQETKAIKCSTTSTVSQYSDNQPSNRRVHSIRKTNEKDRCKCCIAFFLWGDGYYYLDYKTTSLTHTGHPPYSSEAKLKGIRYISEQSKLFIERMSAVGVHPAQLAVLLEMLDDADGTYQSATVRNLVQKCELLHQKELGIDHTMSSAEKAMEFLNR
jgi:hypothetical protein